MNCRLLCGACCIAPQISSPIPGMPLGKPAGVRCVQLDQDFSCKLFGRPERPQVCADFAAEEIFCGADRGQALERLSWLEVESKPS